MPSQYYQLLEGLPEKAMQARLHMCHEKVHGQFDLHKQQNILFGKQSCNVSYGNAESSSFLDNWICCNNCKAKPIDWINKNITLEKPLKGAELDPFMASLARSLQVIFHNIKFSLRIMENLMCEAYRHFLAQLRGRVTFNDTLQLDQWAFVFNGQSMMFVSADGSKGNLGTAI